MLNVNYGALPEIACPVCEVTGYSPVTTRFDGGRLVRCTACGHLYLNPPLSAAQLDAIYSTYNLSDDDDAWMATIAGWFRDPGSTYQYALGRVEQQGGFAGKRVLEVGCGPGHFLHECQARGAQVTGIDLSPHAVELAQRYFGLQVMRASLEDAVAARSLPEAGYDVIFLFEVIEHVQKPGEFMRLLHSLLAPGGLLILSTPNFHLFDLMGGAAPVVTNWQEHLHFFDAGSLTHLLQRAGFEPQELATRGTIPYVARQKEMLVRRPAIGRTWERVRHLPGVRALKNGIFNLVATRKDAADAAGESGLNLICVARKPTT